MIHRLSIDLETYSDVDIKKSGAFRYVNSPAFEILLISYSFDRQPVVTIDVASGESVPEWFIGALHDSEVVKSAYNAAFEWECLSKVYGRMIPSQWRDTMLHGLYAGYTAGLDATGKALGLPEDKQKLNTGKALIRYFCVPCKPTKSNGGRTRNFPQHDPDRWSLFKEYNAQDVVTETAIEDRLSAFPVPDIVQKQWETDLLINARGITVDMDFVNGALVIGENVKDELTKEAVSISGLQNPNSVKQLVGWLATEDDSAIDNLKKETVSDLLAKGGHSENVQRMLEIRQELGKTSTKKYDAIEDCLCSDGRVRGLLQFYGANRTGRWAGRLVQVQNLPRTYTEPLELARNLIKDQRKDSLRLIYGSVSDTLSQLIRTAFIATPGNVLIDADFSAIEARVIAWVSGETWVLDAFRAGKDIYCETASQMFKVPVVKNGVNGHLRQRGKVATLACGYQGGVGAMRRMDTGHLLDDVPDEEVQGLVDDWRRANPHTVQLWRNVEDAAVHVIRYGGKEIVRGLTFAREYDSNTGITCMTISLPAGRKLYYINPALDENAWGGSSISYTGVDQTSKQWKKIETYGGKIVENIIQAIARDCLAEAIERLEKAGYPVIFHIHDEVVIDITPYADDKKMLNDVISIMSEVPSWAEGLPLNGDGWVGKFFKKD